MAFVEVTPPKKSATGESVSGSDQVSIRIRKSVRGDQKMLVVSLGSKLIGKLGWTPDQAVKLYADMASPAFRIEPIPASAAANSFRLQTRRGGGVSALWTSGLLDKLVPERGAAICKCEVLEAPRIGKVLVVYGELSWFKTTPQATKAA